MAKNFSFNVFMGLQAQKFNQGLRRVESSLNRMKMKFKSFAATLGMGLGIGELFKNMARNAKSMDQASTTLKNVSNGYEELIENQEFVMKLAEKYNQDIIGLTGNFAKFHSAADQSNMALSDQQTVFESLTRAATFFNLTADETNGVMLAITQMMSKGKVSSEELRRQLGERLPGAVGIMASALGMTTAQLDAALKRGEIMSRDALPKFAKALNQITGAIDVDTIQGQTNRVKNAFTMMVKSFNIKGTYKKGLRALANSLDWIAKHTQNVIAIIKGALAALITKQFSKFRVKYVDGLKRDLSDLERSFSSFEKKKKSGMQRYNTPTSPYHITEDPNKPGRLSYRTNKNSGADYKSTAVLKKKADLIKEIDRYEQEYSNKQKAIEAQQRRVNQATGFWRNLLGTIWGTIKAIASSLAFSALMGVITGIIEKFRQARKEMKNFLEYTKKVNEEFEKTREDLGDDGNVLKEMKKRVELDETEPEKNGKPNFKYDYTDKDRQDAIDAFNVILGLKDKEELKDERTIKNYKKINKLVDDRLSLIQDAVDLNTKETLLADAIVLRKEKQKELDEAKKKSQAADNDLTRQVGQKTKKNKKWYEIFTDDPDGGPDMGLAVSAVDSRAKSDKVKKLETGLASLETLISQYTSDIAALRKKLGIQEKKDETNAKIGEIDDNYAEIKNKYNKELGILNDKKKRELITEAEYNKELKELTNTIIDEIYALDKSKFVTDDFAKKMLEQALALNATDKLNEIQEEYNTSMKELKNQKDAELLTDEEYTDAMDDLVVKTLEAIVALGDLNLLLTGFGKDIKGLYQEVLKKRDEKAKAEKEKNFQGELKNLPKLGTRDTLFDFEKEGSEILGEKADMWKAFADGLREVYENVKNDYKDEEFAYRIDVIRRGLEMATKNAKDFKAAADLAQINEKVKDLQTQVTEGVVSGFSNVASAIENIKQGIDSIMEDFSDPETTGWEKFFSVLNMVSQTLDGILQSFQMFEQVSKVIDQLSAAMTAQKEASMAAGAAELAMTGTQVAANQAEAMTAGTASAAKLPFPANLAAIAAVLGTIGALFAALPKYANGGIIGGHSSSGDKLLARVNSGEMILNKGQQATLYGMLNKQSQNAGNVQFKIRGADLVGTLDNYRKKISK